MAVERGGEDFIYVVVLEGEAVRVPLFGSGSGTIDTGKIFGPAGIPQVIGCLIDGRGTAVLLGYHPLSFLEFGGDGFRGNRRGRWEYVDNGGPVSTVVCSAVLTTAEGIGMKGRHAPETNDGEGKEFNVHIYVGIFGGA